MLLIPELQIDFDALYDALIEGYRDPLTGCLNARAWAEQRQNPTEHKWAFYLDLNDLKKVNDSKGHKAGDIYIKKAGQAVRSVFKRSTDLFFRHGGDEFIVLSSYYPSDLSALDMFSIGVAEITEGVDQAVCEADQAMYENKRLRKCSQS